MELDNMKVLTVMKEGSLYRNYVYPADVAEDDLEMEVAKKLDEYDIDDGSDLLFDLMEDGYICYNDFEFYLSETIKEKSQKVHIKPFTLVGVDGNAWFIMGYVQNAMRTAKMSNDEIKKYHDNATNGDYNHLLCVSMEMIDKCNKMLDL